MKRRMAAFFMTASIVFSMCVSFAYAVTPADPLLASAVYSFILSAGYRLFREGGINGSETAAETLIDDVKTLYNEFHQESGSSQDWSSMGQGVTIDNAGNFIYNYDSALTLQSFADWLSNKNAGPNTTTILRESQSSSGSDQYGLSAEQLSVLRAYNRGLWELPVKTNPSYFRTEVVNNRYKVYESNAICYVSQVEGATIPIIHYIGLNEFTVQITTYEIKTNGDVVVKATATDTAGIVTLDGVINPNNEQGFSYYELNYGRNDFEGILYLNDIKQESGYHPGLEMGYCILSGYAINNNLIGDLIGKLSGALVNQVYGLTDDQAISIETGAGSEASQEAIVTHIAEEYALPGTATIATPIATPVPIEGVTELYPQPATTDINSLGLPNLGQAIASRFPFCIPFDVVNTYKSLNATAVCPVIEVDLFSQSFKTKVGITGSTSFTINFGDQKYSLFIKLIHWGSLVGFVLMLTFATKRLIWTTGG